MAALVSLTLAAGAHAADTPAQPTTQPTPTPSTPQVVGGDELGATGLVVHPAAGVPQPPTVVASGWTVTDLDTGEVLGAYDPHGRFGPASTLKVLTALVMLPKLAPTQRLLASSEEVAVDGSKVGVVPNHYYTVDMLFTGMLVVSGNDATRVLTGALGGDNAVLSLMNAKAKSLQAYDTNAKTVTGLDAPGQSTSAYDLALISRAALDLPSFRRYVAIPRAQFSGTGVPGFTITTHNLLLGNYPGTYGVKNGYTDASRATYVGAARQNGHNLMVTMVRTDPEYRKAAEALLNWGFAADGKVTPVGILVGPANTKVDAAPQPTGSALANTATATATPRPDRAPHTLGGLEYSAIGAGAGAVALFFGRRRQVRRRQYARRRRLTLPPL